MEVTQGSFGKAWNQVTAEVRVGGGGALDRIVGEDERWAPAWTELEGRSTKPEPLFMWLLGYFVCVNTHLDSPPGLMLSAQKWSAAPWALFPQTAGA